MNQKPVKHEYEPLETRLEQAARNFPYPPTPDIAQGVTEQLAARPTSALLRPRQVAWATILAVIVLAVLLAVPPVRATVLEVLRLGAVRIFLIEPTPTATVPPPAATPDAPPTTTPRPSAIPISSILDLAGETSLAAAQAQVDFTIRLPKEPMGLGPPDKIYFQDFEGPLIVLVWLKPDQPEQVQLSLHLLGPDTIAGKSAPELIKETTVNGRRALWLAGPHLFQLQNGSYDMRRLVEGNVLIWTEGEVTYRLETALPLAEAIRMAESLE